MIEAIIAKSEPKTVAGQLIRHIGARFNELRREGRSAAWAAFEGQISESGYILVEAGMCDLKGWQGMLIDIEQFRKTDAGTGKPAGDMLAEWLTGGAL